MRSPSLPAAALLLFTSTLIFSIHASPTCHPSPSSQCAKLASMASVIGISDNITYNTTYTEPNTLSFPNITGTNTSPLCRVQGTIPYGPENNNTLLFELWLPPPLSSPSSSSSSSSSSASTTTSPHYNSRYLSVGNGGFAGTIDYSAMLTYLNTGYAVAGSDSGHRPWQNGPTRPGGYVDFMNNNPSETRAWIQDSIAIFTTPARALTEAYYSSPPARMYFAGCSTGGAQGFALAQYHPELFDGIWAGSPGNWYSHLVLSFLWNGLSANRSAEAAIIPQAGLELIRDAAVAECDALDGVEDGIIGSPGRCGFDVATLQCADGVDGVVGEAGDSATTTTTTTTTTTGDIVCLTAAQVETAKKIYDGPKRSDDGVAVYPGFAPGSEAEWLAQEEDLWIQYGIPILQNLVFANLSYDYQTFNWGSDVDVVDRTASPLIDEISADLSGYQGRGGKLLVMQGWADPYNAPTWPIEHREQIKGVLGEEALEGFFRLFMVPGGGHCGGATSYPQMPGTWHGLEALVDWVEGGKGAPESVLATGPKDGSHTTRKLCAWPKEAVLKQGGDQDSYDGYTCE